MGVEDIITLPNVKHGIKECVLTFFLKFPIEDLESFEKFYETGLKDIFHKHDTLNTFSITFPLTKEGDKKSKVETDNLGGYRLYKLSHKKTPEIICQFINEKNRQFFAIHCVDYKTWKFFKSTCKIILERFNGWIKNEITAFNLYYIDEFRSKETTISLDRIFRKESDLLPSGFFKSQNTFLVFNTQRADGSSAEYFDKIELKNQNRIMSIGHSTIIPTSSLKFEESFNSEELWSKIDWAHDNNKSFLRDILSIEVQNYIGLT
ncbi:MAG: TIGR04255 family protein [Muricauda sp.]|nr:TIGR04255 family protein [Allomuricauda sp.]MBO6828733.1 TIGR04255 family protein [Allomuricauda sp.]